MAEADVGYYITDNIALFAGARYTDIDAGIAASAPVRAPGSTRICGHSASHGSIRWSGCWASGR